MSGLPLRASQRERCHYTGSGTPLLRSWIRSTIEDEDVHVPPPDPRLNLLEGKRAWDALEAVLQWSLRQSQRQRTTTILGPVLFPVNRGADPDAAPWEPREGARMDEAALRRSRQLTTHVRCNCKCRARCGSRSTADSPAVRGREVRNRRSGKRKSQEQGQHRLQYARRDQPGPQTSR